MISRAFDSPLVTESTIGSLWALKVQTLTGFLFLFFNTNTICF